MGWRDRLRRRAATPAAATPSAAVPDQGVPGTPGAAVPGGAASDAPVPSVPGDWDGGWRRTAAPELTVSRAPLGVSDGLAFRAGLAAWQNPSFGSGLGHALLPAAPAGLVHGVTRPAAPRAAHTSGGPLLLRALRPQGAEGTEGGVRAEGAPEAGRPPVAGERRRPGATGSRPGSSAVRPSGAGGGTRAGQPGPGAAPSRSRGLTATDSPAVLAASPAAVQRAVVPGASPVVAPADTGRPPAAPRTPLVRRVVVVPPAAAARTPSAPGPGRSTPEPGRSAPDPGRAPAARSASGGRTPSGPAARRAVTEASGRQPEPSRASGADAPHAVVRPSPSRPRLTVARRPAGPVRRIAAVRPATPPAPTRDPSGTSAGTGAGPSGTSAPAGTGAEPSGTAAPAGPSAESSAPVQRSATPSRGRAHLGAPLTQLPSTAQPLGRESAAPGAGSAPGPALPVVQRQGGTPVPRDSGTSAFGGTASPAPRRAPAPDGSGARARGGLGAPLAALPPSAALPDSAASPASHASHASGTGPGPDGRRAPGADAPLLGTADGRSSLAERSTTGGTTTGAPPAAHGSGPATPLVAPSPAVAPERSDPAHAVATGGAAAAGKAGAGGPGSGGPRAEGPASGSHRADGPRSGGQRPLRSAVPGPVVVARAVAPGTAGIRSAGSADPRRLTATGSAAHPPIAAPRTLSLLAARPLTLSSRLPEGAAPPVVARSGGRPVVAARWPAPVAAQGDTAPPTGTPAHRTGRPAVSPAASPGGPGTPVRPLPGPSASGPAAPQVQRAAAAHVGPEGLRSTQGAPGGDSGVRTSGSPAPVQRVPVVRPAPPRPVSAGAAIAVPAKPLPVTAPQAPPLADRPAGGPAPVGSLPGSLPAVRPRTAVAPGAVGPVQRDATGADPLKGVQGKEVPARGRPRSSSAPPAPAPTATSGKAAASRRRRESPQDDPGLDLDDLARRLIDPVSRLLRTELRRGRERTGRPYDGRR